ncbi:MAG TPA: EamA family transporter [Candidatus Binatia bacterium]|nr:EamA family transporter [Candidatus Binatia bacterium]
MPSGPNLRGKTAVLLFLMVFFGAAGDTLLGKGMRVVGPPGAWNPAEVASFLGRAVVSAAVWTGFASLLLFFLSYMLVLTWADFSYVLPASAASYAVVPLLGHFFLGEGVSPLRWCGVALIALGVGLVGQTPPSTSPVAAPAAATAETAQGD